ncbi:MAG: helix-turn-helix transcriptional regulator, partial [Pseudobutyrivibrio sp.]|nr:helix-turn-helix transcriptional regulator [Pseudobutyrivibrio sp.]
IHSSSDSLAETRCKLCIYNILVKISEHVLAHINYSLNDESTLDTGWSYIQAACTYIIENSADDINQKDVADHVGLSTFYLSKLFKRYMNMSFPAYLSNIRVQAAAKLLMDKSISITDCAFLAGFQSTTAFNKAFHEITGYSPRDYRKLYR